MSATILGSFLLIALLGMPLAFALGFSALVALFMSGVDFNMLPQRMMHSVNAFPLMAIPLFMLAGELMIRGGLAERLIELANAFIGRVAGGLAQVTMLAGAGMAAVSGAAPLACANAARPRRCGRWREPGERRRKWRRN